VAVALQVDGDHAAVRGQRGEIRAEHVAGHDPAMQQHEWLAGALFFHVDLHAIDGDALLFAGVHDGSLVGWGEAGTSPNKWTR
jgi:hypothetical protein